MAKGKSSASSNTRKKHAAKKSGNPDEADQPNKGQQQPKQRGQKESKLSKAQRKALPKVKQYIPPPKAPAPPIPDPLDSQGLGRTLPPELVVVLRRLGKKDEVTRRKGIEELREGWGEPVLRGQKQKVEEEDALELELKEEALVSALPVWLHHLSTLLHSPSHRAPSLALFSLLLSIPSCLSSVLNILELGLLPGTQHRDLIGSWLVSSLEEGRRPGPGGAGLRKWDEIVYFSPLPKAQADEQTSTETESRPNKLNLTPNLPLLVEYLASTILTPADLHADLHPQPVSSAVNTPSTNSPAPSARVLAKALKQQSRPSAATVPTVSTQATESDADGDASNDEERWGRYRLTGLMGLAWVLRNLPEGPLSEPLLKLLNNQSLWTCLSSQQVSPIAEELNGGENSQSLGYEQPGVRRAGYALLAILVDKYAAIVADDEMLPVLSRAVLCSCWIEKEGSVWEAAGQSIIVFLSKYRQCWDIAAQSNGSTATAAIEAETSDDDNESQDSDDDDDEDAEENEDENKRKNEAVETGASADATASHLPTSAAFDAFLSFLANICPLHPHATYPLLLVIISTIPASILPLHTELAVANIFSHLWSPADARVLSTHSLPGNNNLSAFQVFLQAALDSAAYLTGKAWRIEEARGKDVAVMIVREEVANKAWVEGVLMGGGRAGRRHDKGLAREEIEAEMVGKVLARAKAVDESLVNDVLPIIRERTLQAAFPEEVKASKSVLPRLRAIVETLASSSGLPQVKTMTEGLLGDILRLAVESSQSLTTQGETLEKADKERFAEVWQLLIDFVANHPACVRDEQYATLSQELITRPAYFFTNLQQDLAADVYTVFATYPEGKTERGDIARALAAALAPSSNMDREIRLRAARAVLSKNAHSSPVVEDGWLDDVAMEVVQGALAGDKQSTEVVPSVIGAPVGAISADAAQGMLAMITTAVHTLTEDVLCAADSSAESATLVRLQYAVDALRAHGDISFSELLSPVHVQAIVATHHLVCLFDRPKISSAEPIWTLARTQLTGELKDAVLTSLASLLAHSSCTISPSAIVRAANAVASQQDVSVTSAEIISRLLPTEHLLEAELDIFATKPASVSLPILDPIIPYDGRESLESPTEYDNAGLSTVARQVDALIALLYMDRALALSNSKLLAVALSFATLASDELAVVQGARGLFKPTIAVEYLERVIQDVGQLFSYVLSMAVERPSSWHTSTLQALKAKDMKVLDDVQRLMVTLHEAVMVSRGNVHARVFRNVLSGVLRSSSASAQDAEVWLAYAMTLCEKNTQLSIAIISAVKEQLLDGKAFDTAQNRLASTLTGVTHKRANTQGVTYLRLLAASAPPPGAASTFINQQRAMFVMRHVAGWLTDESDEADDLAEEVEARVAEVFTALAPIVQDVPGAHWDSIFDLIESSLEAASLSDETTYGLLYQNLVLLTEVKDLCDTNKGLRATWTAKPKHLGLVLKLFLEDQPTTARSEPLEMIQEKLVDLLRDASADVVETADYAQLSTLLRTSPLLIQRAAYSLLRDLTVRKTGQLVLDVEASIADAGEGHEGKKTIELAPEVVEVARQGKGVSWAEAASHDGAHLVILGQLLAWMTIFDHFEDASNTLRGAYLDQIRNEGLVEQGLLPMLFEMLGISEVGAWNFPAGNFAVDEFYVSLLEIHELADLTPLAAHVFYRALTSTPSIVRSFFEACKDRQLSLSLLNFTSRHFSPVIIFHEFAALKVPAAIAQLAEEGLNVKVVTGGGASGVGSAEAVASYEIDEQPMEIGIRLPSDFPLRGVEVRDLRRVGVPENKWRGWLMGVQQLITSRNGLMLEALTVFKKNVALHFDGVVECAICYSIISLTDRSLPTKPCRTCKNRFHSSCLFKWFNSSHSSSCPMCRSLF